MSLQPEIPPPPPPRFRPPSVGEAIEHNGSLYWLGRAIGQGYFGQVFKCRDEWDNELVAKVLLPSNRSYEQVKNDWGREISNLLNLRHPNITFIHDAFEYRETFYLIIERCSFTLDDVIKLPKLDGDLWCPHIGRDVLSALHYIHRFNYIHKDLHPGNVFVSELRDRMVPQKEPVWRFKIGDLGISNLVTQVDWFNTRLADWMLPPEFLDPSSFGPVGPKVDLYHVGLLLLSLVLGKSLTFTRSEIVDGRPRQLAESSSSQFAPVIAKALRRHTNARPNSALDMYREIAAIAQNLQPRPEM